MDDAPQSRTLVRNRNFLSLWLGQLISNLGDNLLHINAIGFALSAAQGAGQAMAAILILSTLPALLIGSLAGVVCDRVNRKAIMITSDLLRATLLALLPWAATAGFWTVGVVLALISAVACFFGPARTSLIPLAVSPKQLVAANAWFATSGFLVALAGTVIGSWLMAFWGLTASLWINALVYGLSAIVISVVRIRANVGALQEAPPLKATPRLEPQPASASLGAGWPAGSTRHELRDGWRLIARHRAIRVLILHYLTLMGLASAVYVGLVGLSGRETMLGMKGMSGLLTALVGGLLLGGVVAHRCSRVMAAHRLIRAGLAALTVAALAVAGSSSLASLLASLVLLGAGASLYASVIEASLQRIVPDALRGRTIATRGMASGLAVLVSSALSGWLIDHADKSVLFGIVAGLCLVGLAAVEWSAGAGGFFRSVRWILRQLGFAYFRLAVNGLSQIPARGPAVIAGNHPNVLDGILLLIVSPRPVRFLVAEELFFHPFLHGIFRGMGCIPVYRTRRDNGEALRAAYEALRRGEVIGIFPEGTTTDLGRMRAIKRGVGLLALKTGVPVVPLGIWGSAQTYPEGSRVPRPGRIALSFAPPVRYVRTLADPIPNEMLSAVLEDIRWEIVGASTWSIAACDTQRRDWEWKRVQVGLSALIVLPLAGFLSLTSNPSLDPTVQKRPVS